MTVEKLETTLENNRQALCKNDIDNCKQLTTINFEGSKVIKFNKPSSSTNPGLEIKFDGVNKNNSGVVLGGEAYKFEKAKLFSNSYASTARNIVASLVLYHRNKVNKSMEIHIPFEKNNSYYNSLMWFNNILYSGSMGGKNVKTPKLDLTTELTLNDIVPLNTPYYYVHDVGNDKEYIFFDRYFPLSINNTQLKELRAAVDNKYGDVIVNLPNDERNKIYYSNTGIPSEDLTEYSSQQLDCEAIEIDGEPVEPKSDKTDADMQKDSFLTVYEQIFKSDFFTVILGILIALITFAIMKNILESINDNNYVAKLTGGLTGNTGT
mgnify:CR=1 FL=1